MFNLQTHWPYCYTSALAGLQPNPNSLSTLTQLRVAVDEAIDQATEESTVEVKVYPAVPHLVSFQVKAVLMSLRDAQCYLDSLFGIAQGAHPSSERCEGVTLLQVQRCSTRIVPRQSITTLNLTNLVP